MLLKDENSRPHDDTWKELGLFFWSFCTIVSLYRLIVNTNHYSKLSFQRQSCCFSFFAYITTCRPSNRSKFAQTDSDSFRIMQQNLWFHVFSFVGALLEVPKYAVYIWFDGNGDDDGKSSNQVDGDDVTDDGTGSDASYSIYIYPLHLLSLLCIYISFCIIINLWGSAIVFEARDGKKASILRFILFLLSFIDLLLIVATMTYGLIKGTIEALIESWYYKVMVFYQTFGMIILSVFFLIFGYAAQRKIWRTFTRSDDWSNDHNFWRGLIRLNVIIVVCFACFSMKAFCLFFLLNDSSDQVTSNPFTSSGVSTTEWYFMYEWIPDIVPRLALLYLMSRNISDEETASHRSALSTSGDGVMRDESDDRFHFSRGFERSTEADWGGGAREGIQGPK